MRGRAAWVVLAAFLAYGGWATDVRAAGGISVSPPVQQLVYSQAPSTPFSVTVTNNTSVTQTLIFSVEDFGQLNDTGGVAFSGLTQQQLTRFGLSRWVHLDEEEATLESGQSQAVSGELVNNSQVTPGGHYGAIVISTQQPESSVSHNEVQLRQEAAALLFAVKTDGESFQLRLDQLLGLGSFQTRLPASMWLRFFNGGNVQETPRGTITITDPAGKPVSQGVINVNSVLILPQTFRQIVTTMEPLASPWLPGRYKVTVSYRYDGSDKLQDSEQSFVLIPWDSVLLLLVVLGVFYGLIRLHRAGFWGRLKPRLPR